jgi:hypothetical protein
VDSSAVNDQIMMMVNQAVDNLTHGLFPDLYLLVTWLITFALIIVATDLIIKAIDRPSDDGGFGHIEEHGYVRTEFKVYDESGKVVGKKYIDEKY